MLADSVSSHLLVAALVLKQHGPCELADFSLTHFSELVDFYFSNINYASILHFQVHCTIQIIWLDLEHDSL
jgi:hypothetical protein